ncbi:hypothetical protein [Agrobacterium sp.]|uniref:hypothetical protein n=1 Tax=Agrobacterium sp. TaxID=361 RepID=UPI00289ECD71|nr:hypothetical protein [Agrobacterium sp.]
MFNHSIVHSSSGFDESEINASIAAALDTAFSNAASAGETGWVIAPPVDMSGVSTIDLAGIPEDAQEVIVRIQGMSSTATVNLAGQFLDQSGGVIATPNYFGYASTLTSSGTTGSAWNGVGYVTHMVSMPAANYTSGIIRLVKMHRTYSWHLTSILMDGTRQCVSSGVKSSMELMFGFRLGIVGATFDAGTCGIAWRK